tara:strand:- start:2 stop:451 length:450 start_codon:yes stop_codon:yes gene_type:complete
MTSTITASTLTITVQEQISLKGEEQGTKNVKTIASINEVIKRIVTVTTTKATVLTTGAAVAQGQVILTDIKYIRFTNLDDTNFIILELLDTSGDVVNHKLEAGCSFMVFNDDIECFANGSAFSAFSQWDTVTADADTASCDLEMFIASA